MRDKSSVSHDSGTSPGGAPASSPGKVSRTESVAPVAPAPFLGGAAADSGSVRSLADWTRDPWMDAAHRGTDPTAGADPMVGGFMPGVDPKKNQQMIGGLGERLGDAGRVIGTAAGNVVGGAAALATGIDITAATTTAAAWRDHGEFEWIVGFATTGTSGWLVQEVANTYRAQDNANQALGGAGPTPLYWEAWAVDAAGAISPGAGGSNDWWLRPGRGANTKGHWSMRGKVYFTTTDPATQGFTVGGAPDAGRLLSSTAAPAGLGVARLHRYAQGTWDSTGAAPTHEGSAS